MDRIDRHSGTDNYFLPWGLAKNQLAQSPQHSEYVNTCLTLNRTQLMSHRVIRMYSQRNINKICNLTMLKICSQLDPNQDGGLFLLLCANLIIITITHMSRAWVIGHGVGTDIQVLFLLVSWHGVRRLYLHHCGEKYWAILPAADLCVIIIGGMKWVLGE